MANSLAIFRKRCGEPIAGCSVVAGAPSHFFSAAQFGRTRGTLVFDHRMTSGGGKEMKGDLSEGIDTGP